MQKKIEFQLNLRIFPYSPSDVSGFSLHENAVWPPDSTSCTGGQYPLITSYSVLLIMKIFIFCSLWLQAIFQGRCALHKFSAVFATRGSGDAAAPFECIQV